MSLVKEDFLRTKLVLYLQQLDPSTAARWGKMSVQHMVEHFNSEAVCIASGKAAVEQIVTAADRLPRMREFMMSERPFKENTKNPLMGEEPAPLQYKTIQAAIGALHEELIHFFDVFEKNTQLVTRNPFFGDLNFEENVQLLHKHALHHLKQFGVVPLSV